MASNGVALELFVKFSKPLVDLGMRPKQLLMDPIVRYEKYHQEFVGFAECIKLY